MKEYVVLGKSEEAEAFTLKALSEGMEASDIVNNGLIPGMDIVGDKFENREYYMPEMLVSAKAMKKAMALLKPLLTKSGSSSGLRAVCGTVAGDLHDIGVSLVGMMFRYMGWDEAADLTIQTMEKSILDGNVTYDLARGRDEAKILKSSEFANSLIDNLNKF